MAKYYFDTGTKAWGSLDDLVVIDVPGVTDADALDQVLNDADHDAASSVIEFELLTKAERFALVTSMDDREAQLTRDAKRAAQNGSLEGRRHQIIANIQSVRKKLRPYIEQVIDPVPGISYKDRD